MLNEILKKVIPALEKLKSGNGIVKETKINYIEGVRVELAAAKQMLKSGHWMFIGETTCGNIFWNDSTGELLFAMEGYYEMSKKIQN